LTDSVKRQVPSITESNSPIKSCVIFRKSIQQSPRSYKLCNGFNQIGERHVIIKVDPASGRFGVRKGGTLSSAQSIIDPSRLKQTVRENLRYENPLHFRRHFRYELHAQ
jgi:hypothetical protein